MLAQQARQAAQVHHPLLPLAAAACARRKRSPTALSIPACCSTMEDPRDRLIRDLQIKLGKAEKDLEIERQVGAVLRATLALLHEAPMATCAAHARCTI